MNAQTPKRPNARTIEIMIKIIIVDDHALYRDGIRASVQNIENFPVSVIGEAGSGAEFFMLLASGKIPDLAMLDIGLPDISGVEIARRLKNEYPGVKVIILSAEVSKDLINELLDIGVEGYLSKMARKENIYVAISTVIGGCRYFGRSVSKMMYDIYLAQQKMNEHSMHGATKEDGTPVKKNRSGLTEREKEIIRLLCNGLQTKEVADELNISVRTVETHKSKVLAKLGFSRMTDLIKYAIKEGLTVL